MFRNRILIILVACFGHISGEEPEVPHQEYLRAFENLPALFDHIVGMLEEKPQILERNDVTTFLEFAAANDGDISPRENGLNVFKRESNFEELNDKDRTQYHDWYLLKADSDYAEFVGSFRGGFQLTAEEVAERMLMVERNLEEYYNETN